jgi:hypothetical protein
MRHRAAFLAFFIALALSLSLAGCSPTEPERKRSGVGGGGGWLLERTSPENVLNNLKVLWSDTDHRVLTPYHVHYWAEEYRELFDPRFRRYIVSRGDTSGVPHSWWDLEAEVALFEELLNLVASGEVTDIDLEFPITPSEPDNRVDPDTGESLHPDWRWTHVLSVLLDVSFSSGNRKRVPGANADFYCGPDPSDPSLWVITEWWGDSLSVPDGC